MNIASFRTALVAVSLSVVGLAPLTASAATPDYASVDHPGGGRIVTASLAGASLEQMTGVLMRYVHTKLGARPQIEQVARNGRDRSLAVLFTATRAGTPYSGIALVNASSPSLTTGAALFDTSARFRSTIGPMMHSLNAMTAASTTSAHAVALAPARPLITHQFGDGTGSIGVPADWILQVANGGSARVASPGPGTGVNIAYNMHFSAVDPSNPRAGMLMNTLAGRAMHPVPLAYTTDPVKAWIAVYSWYARQGGFAPNIVVKHQSTSNGVSTFDGTMGHGPKQLVFLANVFVLPPNVYGEWGLSDSHVMVKASDFPRDGATALAVSNSVRVDLGAVAAQNAAIRKMYADRFASEMQTQKEENAVRERGVDMAMARDADAQEGMHKDAVQMENYSLDRQVVVDTRDGTHSTVGTDFADYLTHENPNYEKVPAKDFVRGVDY